MLSLLYSLCAVCILRHMHECPWPHLTVLILCNTGEWTYKVSQNWQQGKYIKGSTELPLICTLMFADIFSDLHVHHSWFKSYTCRHRELALQRAKHGGKKSCTISKYAFLMYPILASNIQHSFSASIASTGTIGMCYHAQFMPSFSSSK